MLVAKNITKTYDSGRKIALQDFSLEVPKQSIYGLLGPNGAGKTTFIRIINQIIQPDNGEVLVNGEHLHLGHISDIGYMPEERGLYKSMTIGDQLLYLGELKGMKKSQVLSEAKYWFEQLEIEHWWKKKLSELSKGMAQKIQFIVTVLHRPKLLILDEPFSGFDPVNANLIKDQIIKLRDQGTTIILSTHRMESVEEMCDHVALIHNSKKALDGRVFDVKEKFKENKFEVVIENGDLERFEAFQNKYNFDKISTQNNFLNFEIQNEEDSNIILKDLMQIGKIRVFNEKIPSMNEVFINLTTKK